MDIPDFLKVTIIEGEKVLILIFQALDIMSNALGEVPDIPRVEFLGLKSAVLVNSSEEKRSVVNEAPFSLKLLLSLVPNLQSRHLTTLCQCNSRMAPFFRCC